MKQNNWQINGFENADIAMLYAIALTLKSQPEAVVIWKNRAWVPDDFTKQILSSVKEIIN